MTELLRSENNVLLSQRRALAEEVQAVKVARNRLEAELRSSEEARTSTTGEHKQCMVTRRELERAITTLEHELELARGRDTDTGREVETLRDESGKLKEQLRASTIQAEEAGLQVEELGRKARLEGAAHGRDNSDSDRLAQELQELQERNRLRNREFEEMAQHNQELTAAMASFEQRSVECQQKDIEVFNVREETKELLANANMERDAVASREQALQRRLAAQAEQARQTQAELTAQCEGERDHHHGELAQAQAVADERVATLSLQCAEMQQKMERAEREARSLEVNGHYA